MKRALPLAVLLLLAAVRGFAEKPSGETGGRNAPLRMEELEVHGNAPLRMEELEVRGFREIPDVLYLPVHRGIALPAPVRYDLFLEDMEKPAFPREFSPQKRPPDRTFDQGSSIGEAVRGG
jgi:hypothetical protein